MKQDDLESLRRRLIKIVQEEIRSCLSFGPTDIDCVYNKVVERSSMLFMKLQSALAKAHLRHIIQQQLKTVEVKLTDPDDVATAHAEIAQMPLPNLEEFRGIPAQIAYEDEPGHVSYISYADSYQWQRDAALKLLLKQIGADQKKARAMAAGNDYFALLVVEYGDLPVRELSERHRHNERSA